MQKKANNKPKIILLIGQTASGKTQTAIKLAKAVNGEVISADSRQVYKGLDIGADKISKKGMQGIPHHLIDIADPVARGPLATGDVYTVSNFVRDASKTIAEIISRGNVPIVAGGTMLYIDALMGNVTVPEVAPDHALRAELEQRSLASLFEELQAKDPRRAAMMLTEGQDANPRRLIRALEIIATLGSVPEHTPPSSQGIANTKNNEQNSVKKSHVGFFDAETEERESESTSANIVDAPYDALWIGLANEPKVQKEKINKRNAEMLENGLMDEVQQLKDAGITQKQFDTFGFEYKYPAMYLAGIPIIQEETPTMEQVLMKMNSGTWRYAKKQRSWWLDRKEIIWFNQSTYAGLLARVLQFL